MISRRRLIHGALAAPLLAGFDPAARAEHADAARQALAALEQTHGGRLGVRVRDVATGNGIGYRADERFPMCSTFKALAVAHVLSRVDAGADSLDRRITYNADALLPYAPVTKQHVGDGMTLGALCAAAVTLSDNTAANLILASFGGPSALTTWLRTLGDTVTRLDRTEPTLNEGRPGDPRDTSTPTAMAETLSRLAFGTALSQPSRARLAGWMRDCKTGGTKLRAGLPTTWTIGDKTGSAHGISNDVALASPPGRAPLVVTVFYAESPAPDAARDAVIAAVGRLIA